ncbi:hypothetical protein TNCV_5023361 [Trichonephila clavipes]|nr:hypothetical protein TNCV_5023361 [Trichonephila clavipes]
MEACSAIYCDACQDHQSSAAVMDGFSDIRGQPSSRKSSRVVGGRRREVGDPWPNQGFLPLNWGGTEQNRTVTCIVLKAKANDRRKNSSP